MRRFFALFVLAALPCAGVGDDREAETAVKAKVEAALAGLRTGDVDKAMADWPVKAPGRATCREIMKSLVPPAGITLKTTDLEYPRWKIRPKSLTVRVRFTYAWVGKDGKEIGRKNTLYLNTEFVKAGDGWQWYDCSTAIMDTAAEVAAAKTREQ